MRKVETLDSDRKTVNVWRIPENLKLEKLLLRQDSPEVREKYFVSSHPLTTLAVSV